MSKLINPWGDDGAAWDRIVFAGVLFTGRVKVTGRPWKKKHDHRRARGRNGRRSVATGWDLGEWTVELAAIDDEHVEQLGRLIEATTARGADQDSNALPIEHPALAVAGCNQVLLEEGEAPEISDAGGLLTWTAKVKEYRPPEARDVTHAPATAEQEAERAQRYGTEMLEATPMRPRAPTPPSADP